MVSVSSPLKTPQSAALLLGGGALALAGLLGFLLSRQWLGLLLAVVGFGIRAIRMTALRGFLGHDLVVTLGGRHHIWQA